MRKELRELKLSDNVTHSFDIFQLNARYIILRLFKLKSGIDEIKERYVLLKPKPDVDKINIVDFISAKDINILFDSAGINENSLILIHQKFSCLVYNWNLLKKYNFVYTNDINHELLKRWTYRHVRRALLGIGPKDRYIDNKDSLEKIFLRLNKSNSDNYVIVNKIKLKQLNHIKSKKIIAQYPFIIEPDEQIFENFQKIFPKPLSKSYYVSRNGLLQRHIWKVLSSGRNFLANLTGNQLCALNSSLNYLLFLEQLSGIIGASYLKTFYKKYNEFICRVYKDIEVAWRKMDDDLLTTCLIFLMLRPQIDYNGSIKPSNVKEISELLIDIYWERKNPVENACIHILDILIDKKKLKSYNVIRQFICTVIGNLILIFPQLLKCIKFKLILLLKAHDKLQLFTAISIIFYGTDKRYENKYAKQIITDNSYDIMNTYFNRMSYDPFYLSRIHYIWAYYCRDNHNSVDLVKNLIIHGVKSKKKLYKDVKNPLSYFGTFLSFRINNRLLAQFRKNLLYKGFEILEHATDDITKYNALLLIEAFQYHFGLTNSQLKKIENLKGHTNSSIQKLAKKIIGKLRLRICFPKFPSLEK